MICHKFRLWNDDIQSNDDITPFDGVRIQEGKKDTKKKKVKKFTEA
jgi:hypothetical protein